MISFAFSIIVGDFVPPEAKEILDKNKEEFLKAGINFIVVHTPKKLNELAGVTSDALRCTMLRKHSYAVYVDWDCLVYVSKLLASVSEWPDYPKFGMQLSGSLDWFLVYSGRTQSKVIQAADNICKREPGSFYTFVNQLEPRPMVIDHATYLHKHFGYAYRK